MTKHPFIAILIGVAGVLTVGGDNNASRHHVIPDICHYVSPLWSEEELPNDYTPEMQEVLK